MEFLFCVILTFSLSHTIFAVMHGKECDAGNAEIWISGTKAASFEECKKSCEDIEQCLSVTYYDHGGCSHFATTCEKTKDVSNAHSELVKAVTEGQAGQECDLSQGEIWLSGGQEADFAACKKSCEDEAQCQSVTFYAHGACSHFATKCEKTKTSAGSRSLQVKDFKEHEDTCESDGTCDVARGEQCDPNNGELCLADGSGKLGSYDACKKACMDRMKCQSMTYYSHGECSLFMTQCTHREPFEDAVAVTLKADFFNHQVCDESKGEILLSASSGNVADVAACQKSCDDEPKCKSTSFFASGWCSHFSTCCKNTKYSLSATSDAEKGDSMKMSRCVDRCVINNGGCHNERHCTSTDGVASCGDCPAGLVNDGATGCKKPAPADPCKTNNGGCDAKRACTSTGGVATCGGCPAGFTNDGTKGCKAKPKPKPTPPKPQPADTKPSELVFPYPSNYPAELCAKMKPKCKGISAAACKKTCNLKGSQGCCSYRIGGCHSCCLRGYLNDKCCPPGHGKCVAPPKPKPASCVVSVCREHNGAGANKPGKGNRDGDCCGAKGNTGCDVGYTHSLMNTAGWAKIPGGRPAGLKDCDKYGGNTCCTKDSSSKCYPGYKFCPKKNCCDINNDCTCDEVCNKSDKHFRKNVGCSYNLATV